MGIEDPNTLFGIFLTQFENHQTLSYNEFIDYGLIQKVQEGTIPKDSDLGMLITVFNELIYENDESGDEEIEIESSQLDREKCFTLLEKVASNLGIRNDFVKVKEYCSNHEEKQTSYLSWYCFTLSVLLLNPQTKEYSQLINNDCPFVDILKTPNIDLRYIMSHQLISKLFVNNKYQNWIHNTKGFERLAALFIALLEDRGISLEILKLFLKFIQKNDFNDGSLQARVISVLSYLRIAETLSNEDIENLLQVIMQKNNKDERKENLLSVFQSIRGIIDFSREEFLKKEILTENDNHFEHILFKIFKEIIFEDFSLDFKLEEFIQKFSETFGQCRNPTALLIYTSKLYDLEDKDECLSTLLTYLTSVLNNTFHTDRYSKESVHIKKISKTLGYERWNLWKQFKKFSFEEISQNAVKSSTEEDPKQVLRKEIDRVISTYLNSNKYTFLNNFLKAKSDEERSKIKTNLSALLSTKKGDPSLRLQSLCIQLKENNLSSKEILGKLQNIVKLFPQLGEGESEFKHNIDNLIASLSNKKRGLSSEELKRKHANYLFIDTDNPYDILLSSIEVRGSCLRVDGDQNYNKCLLAYLMDGKNRLLAIQDPKSGKLVAKCILRLLWDPKNKIPVLYQEKIYPFNLDKDLRLGLNFMAEARAKELGIPLVREEDEKILCMISHVKDKQLFDIEVLQSLGGPAPYEYVDALNGVQEDSKFTIEIN